MRVQPLHWILIGIVLSYYPMTAAARDPDFLTRVYIVEMALFYSPPDSRNRDEIETRRQRFVNLAEYQQKSQPALTILFITAETQEGKRYSGPDLNKLRSNVKKELGQLDTDGQGLMREVGLEDVLGVVRYEIKKHAEDLRKQKHHDRDKSLPQRHSITNLDFVFVGDDFVRSQFYEPPGSHLVKHFEKILYKENPEQKISVKLFHPGGERPSITEILVRLFRERLQADICVLRQTSFASPDTRFECHPPEPTTGADHPAQISTGSDKLSATELGTAHGSPSSAQGDLTGSNTPSSVRSPVPPPTPQETVASSPNPSSVPRPEPSLEVEMRPDPSLGGRIEPLPVPPNQPHIGETASSSPPLPQSPASPPPVLEVELTWRSQVDAELRVLDEHGNLVPGVAREKTINPQTSGTKNSQRISVGAARWPAQGPWRAEVRLTADPAVCSRLVNNIFVGTLSVRRNGVAETPELVRFDPICEPDNRVNARTVNRTIRP